MAFELTFHGDRPRDGSGSLIDALGQQIGDAFEVSDGEVATLPYTGLYRMAVLSDCRVRFGPDLTDATGGERWLEGESIIRLLEEGEDAASDTLS